MSDEATAPSLSQLRQRTSAKWREYGPDVLPMFVAEHDFSLAPTIARALHEAVDRSDTGYTASRNPFAESYAGFAQRRFGWDVDPGRVRTTADVSMGIVEILRRVTVPGDRVIVTPPVYPPFYELVREAGAVVESVPLIATSALWHLDLPGIEAAFTAGARAMLLCNPHNPTGTVHSRESLAALAVLAERYGARIVSDEIHAPLARAGVTFTPFLDAASEAAEIGYAVVSASKAYNLAGLKCAAMVTAADTPSAVVRGMPAEVEWRTSQFGLLASVAALSPESDAWLDSLLSALGDNARVLGELLATHTPAARYLAPDAGYLAWVDLTALGLGDNPAKRILREAKVAFHFGPAFGPQGAGHVRVNFGCSQDVLREALARVGALAPA